MDAITSTSSYGVKAVDALTSEVLYITGNPNIQIKRGLGGLLLLTQMIHTISLGKIKLNEHVVVSEFAEKESKSIDSIGLTKGERVSVYVLLCALIMQSAPDAIMALAEKLSEVLYNNPALRLKAIKQLGRQLELREDTVKNVSGRLNKSKPQFFNLEDLVKISRYLFSFPDFHTRILNTTTLEYKDRFIVSLSQLVAKGKIVGGYLFGPDCGEGIVKASIKGRKVLISICGAENCFHRDFLLTEVIDKLTYTVEEMDYTLHRKTIDISKKETAVIHFIGDTYFGEEYTKYRQKKSIKDALTEYGYEYSFKAIQPLLQQGDYNIANFEAVLTDLKTSPFTGVKPYILKGDIKESITALQNQRIHAVTLGNNHGMDYGADGLYETIEAFGKGNIITIGAGFNAKDAGEPLRIRYNHKEIVVFSAYWHRQSAYREFDWYAIGNKPGVSNLSSNLTERIRGEKTKSKDAFVIVMVHWGLDFQLVHPTQRKYAEKLIESGTDLIIGHGAHMMQEIQIIHDKWVLYSIGNGVFNSNGEYDKRNVPPYSFLMQLRIEPTGEQSIRLYPLYSNNLRTFWQTHVVNLDQFQEVIDFQKLVGTHLERFTFCSNAFGPFFEVQL